MNVVLISRRTRSVIGIRFTRLASQLKYAGPRSELMGKFPKEPTAGVPNKPGFGTELTAPVAETVTFSRFGLMKNIPCGVRKIPRLFLKSAKVIPDRSTGLLPALKLLKVERLEA